VALEELEGIAKAIYFESLSRDLGPSRLKRISTQEGTLLMSGLLSRKEISIADCWASEDAELQEHLHDSEIFYLVYDGEMRIRIKGAWVTLRNGQLFKLDARTKHSVRWTKETRFISIAVPRGKGFPNV